MCIRDSALSIYDKISTATEGIDFDGLSNFLNVHSKSTYKIMWLHSSVLIIQSQAKFLYSLLLSILITDKVQIYASVIIGMTY